MLGKNKLFVYSFAYSNIYWVSTMYQALGHVLNKNLFILSF